MLSSRPSSGGPATYTARSSITFVDGFNVVAGDSITTIIAPGAAVCVIPSPDGSGGIIPTDPLSFPVAQGAYNFSLHYAQPHRSPAANQEEALKLINSTLDRVEDVYSGIPKASGIPDRDEGRMYGILDEKYVKTLDDGTKIANTKGNRIVLNKDGGFEIQTKDGKTTLFSKPGAKKSND